MSLTRQGLVEYLQRRKRELHAEIDVLMASLGEVDEALAVCGLSDDVKRAGTKKRASTKRRTSKASERLCRDIMKSFDDRPVQSATEIRSALGIDLSGEILRRRLKKLIRAGQLEAIGERNQRVYRLPGAIATEMDE